MLRRLAEKCGIQSAFIDVGGKRREASPDTLRALLRVCGVPADSDADIASSLAAHKELDQQRCFPPVVVQWDGQPSRVPLARGIGRTQVRITPLSDAGRAHSELAARNTRTVESSGRTRDLALPGLPFGYYQLEFELDGARCEALVISAPSKAFAPPNMREWGVFLPMYAAWRPEPQAWAAGGFSDFARLATRISNLGGGVISTLPLMPAFLDSWKADPSPYSPVSRLFWNEFFIDVTSVPEFASSRTAKRLFQSAPVQRDLAALRDERFVDYAREMALKRRLLERLAADFFSAPSLRRAEFDQFLSTRPELMRYAAFRAAAERQRQTWQQWPDRLRGGDFRPGDYSAPAQQFHLYAQWIAQQQVDELLRGSTGNPILRGTGSNVARLYLDLPLGVNSDGYDVWRERDKFVLGASVGAPPDAFFTRGQDWGFPPLHPERIRIGGYQYVIDFLRFQMRHTSMLRLDHAMGLHRLWWVPHGASAAEGAYVRYRAEEFYAILCLESHRHNTMLVGENLGTVPPQVNRALKRHGVRTMYVVQYETTDDEKHPLREPPRECVASINTHDMPSWLAHWEGRDIVDRRELGLLMTAEVSSEAKRRARVRRALEKYLKGRGLLSGKASARSVLAAVLRFLAQSRAELVLVNLEDLWLEPEPQNTPGTTTERINWRRKTSHGFEEMLSRSEIQDLLSALKR